MALCSAITRRGSRCKALALEGSEFCWNHRPESIEHQREFGRIGGQGRSKIERVDADVERLIQAVTEGRVDRRTAAVIGQLYNVRLRALALQAELHAVEELEFEVSKLEAEIAEKS